MQHRQQRGVRLHRQCRKLGHRRATPWNNTSPGLDHAPTPQHAKITAYTSGMAANGSMWGGCSWKSGHWEPAYCRERGLGRGPLRRIRLLRMPSFFMETGGEYEWGLGSRVRTPRPQSRSDGCLQSRLPPTLPAWSPSLSCVRLGMNGGSRIADR